MAEHVHPNDDPSAVSPGGRTGSGAGRDHDPTTGAPRRRPDRDTGEHRDADEYEEYADVDPGTVTDDAIDYFSDDGGAADSPASDADAPPPG